MHPDVLDDALRILQRLKTKSGMITLFVIDTVRNTNTGVLQVSGGLGKITYTSDNSVHDLSPRFLTGKNLGLRKR